MTKQPTLTKADLIEEVLRITELPRKESETIVETIFDSIIESLQKGQKIEIRGFGSLGRKKWVCCRCPRSALCCALGSLEKEAMRWTISGLPGATSTWRW